MAAMKISPLAPAAAGALTLLLCACCSRTGRPLPIVEPAPQAEPPAVFQSGIASWYGDDFHGKTTADGEVYDMHKLTAAHPQLPFHSLVEVENLGNGRRVLVRINDRGPFLKGRIIDLSLAAATRLGMADLGTADVCLRVLRWGDQVQRTGPIGVPTAVDSPGGAQATPSDHPPAPGAGSEGCVVQVGAFSLRENAEDLLLTLAEIFPAAPFRVAAEGGLFKVVSPELGSRDECLRLLEKLAACNLQGFLRSTAPAAAE